MNDEFEDVQKLIRLKRYEQPPEGYMDGFLKEFHQRQRVELMRRSSRSLFFERLGTYFSGLGGGRLLFAGGVAAAIALAVLVTRPLSTPGDGVVKGAPAHAIDAPQGTLNPVAEELLSEPSLPKTAEQEGAEEVPFRMSPRPRPDAETHVFEL